MADIQKTQNTTGLIQGVAQRPTLPSTQVQKPEKLKDLISTTQVRDMFRNALQDHADAFLASVVDLYNNDRTLQACNPNEVLMEAFKAATLKLPINKQLGFSWIVPFKDNKQGKLIPTFQLGYKGYIQLCMRTGAYRHIHAGPVYEGEFVSENRLTGEVDLSGKRVSDRITGFSAYIETVNGFSKATYWPVEKINAHAKRYSKSYGYQNSPWTTNYEEMGVKTVLRYLLSKYGIMSIEMQRAYMADYGEAADELLQARDEDLGDVREVFPAAEEQTLDSSVHVQGEPIPA